MERALKRILAYVLFTALTLLPMPHGFARAEGLAAAQQSISDTQRQPPAIFMWFMDMAALVKEVKEYAQHANSMHHSGYTETEDTLHPEDLKALEALYAACGGKKQVFFDQENGHITTLFVYLTGTEKGWELPEEIVQLSTVTGMGLYGLEFAKPLPDALFSMQSLETLMIGQYPWPLPEDISGMRNIEMLSFEFCDFPNLPESIGKLTSLRTLVVQKGKLTSLPESLGNLQQLESLEIMQTPLQSLPVSLGNMAFLRYLYVYQGKLTDLPENIGNLKNLEKLMLRGNAIHALPASITGCHSLRSLDAGSNALTDSAFPIIAALPSLKVLNLHKNALSGPLPKMLFAMPELIYLNLSENNFSGTVPASLMDAPSLSVLVLTANPRLKGQMLPFMSTKSMESLGIYETGLEYAPEDAAYLEAEMWTPRKPWEKEKRENLVAELAFSFMPEKTALFGAPAREYGAESDSLDSDPAKASFWGEDVSLSFSIWLPFNMTQNAQNIQVYAEKVQPYIEQAMQKLLAISKKDMLHYIAKSHYDIVDAYNLYGTKEDWGEFLPIRSIAELEKLLQIESVVVWVEEPEENFAVTISVCMKEEVYLMSGLPMCGILENGVFTGDGM